MAFWWVNHRKTRDHEVSGGYLWSPLRKANDVYHQTYENMTLVRRGDIVFSFANARISAMGIVTEAASASPKPDEFGSVGDYWATEGWLVEVYFRPLPTPFRPQDKIREIAPLLPAKYAPVRPNGHGNENCYLAGISDALGYLLLALGGVEEVDLFASASHYVQEQENDAATLADLRLIEIDTSIPETHRIQLAKARIGQGLFRNRVMALGPRCRVTGVEDPRLLIASHIKPWRDATNAERVNGYNGIMLSPHIDALFDERLISFEANGRMLTHHALPNEVLERWSIGTNIKVEEFKPEQAAFLDHHRALFAARIA